MEALSGQTQEMSSESVGNMLVTGPKGGSNPADRKARPAPEHALKCPRCDSANTKFCYYNNYSLTQPRYFCKACRRYWTKGGTLRNVPVGGGCRKNRRPSSTALKRAPQDHLLSPAALTHHHSLAGFTIPNQMVNPNNACYDQNDLALAFARLQKSPDPLGFGHDGFLDALRSGFPTEPNHNNNIYYGFDVSERSTPTTEMSVPYEHDQMSNATTTAVTMTTIKQELSNGNGRDHRDHRDHHDQDHHQSNRMLWGYPWQLNGGEHHGSTGNVMMSEFDGSANGRESWNGLAPSWHGLLNTTPLM